MEGRRDADLAGRRMLNWQGMKDKESHALDVAKQPGKDLKTKVILNDFIAQNVKGASRREAIGTLTHWREPPYQRLAQLHARSITASVVASNSLRQAIASSVLAAWLVVALSWVAPRSIWTGVPLI